MVSDRVFILGAGPAGMGCAYTLAKAGQSCLVIEKEASSGGLCRTINFCDYLFDIGGHRFLSRSEEINKLWLQVMGKDILHVKRSSQIYYKKKYFNYPLSFLNTFLNLNPIENFLCLFSYLKHKFFNSGDNNTFENWVINRFGKRLFELFFKAYTEKIWGIPCQHLSADWARQRIRGLSLRTAIQNTFLGKNRNTPKTLSEEFLYPKNGSGEFYQRLERTSSEMDTLFSFNTTVMRINYSDHKVISVEALDCLKNEKKDFSVDYLFSSMALPTLIKILNPKPPENIIAAADKLRFRSLIAVNIILDKEFIFSGQWLYINSPEVKLARIQNYKNWSKFMLIDRCKTSLGIEYFCTQGDSFWKKSDADLIQHAVEELERIGITSQRLLVNGFVVRCPDAYPVYSLDYKANVDTIKKYLEQFSNLQTMGRGGLFRYDNSDHALLSGIYAARNFLGDSSCKIWELNMQEDYL